MVTDIVTETAPTVIVYVDQFGNTITAPAAATPAPVASVVDAPAVAPASAAAQVTAAAAPAPAAPAPVSAAAAGSVSSQASSGSASFKSGSKSSSSSGSSGSASGLGIVYSPYNNDGSCKTANEVATDFGNLAPYSTVRIYSTDCNQVANVIAAAQPRNINIFAGIYDISDVASEISLLVQGFSGGWAGVTAVSIGNELVNSGKASVDQVVAAVNIARPLLRVAGYTGPVVTVDTFNAVIANPALCEASDFAAVNAHPFFDPTATAQNAGEWAVSTAANVKSACGGKRTVITESGWPSAGDANSAAVPSPENQAAAIASLKSHFTEDLILFSAYNDLWKTNSPATFNTEQSWGIYGDSFQG